MQGVCERSWQLHMPQVPCDGREGGGMQGAQQFGCAAAGDRARDFWGRPRMLQMAVEEAALHRLQEEPSGVSPLQAPAGVV